MKFTIERSKWFRGQGVDPSFLLTEDGKKCCLGFFSLACGLKKKHIRGIKSPHHIPVKVPEQMRFLIAGKDASDASVALMSVNDSTVTFEKKREKQLTKLFAKEGIEVEFVD